MSKQSILSASVVLALSAAPASGAIHLLSGAVKVDTHSCSKRSVVTITRTGKFYDPRYGEFELTQQMFDDLVKNFNENVYGQEININIDIAHHLKTVQGRWCVACLPTEVDYVQRWSGTNSASAKSPKKALNTWAPILSASLANKFSEER